MSLTETINNDIKEAMKAKDQAALRGLRSIKSALLLLATEKGAGEVNEDAELKALQKLAKQRKDSIEIYEQQNREDLAADEREELAIIEKFLPKQLGEAEVKAILEKIIAETGASSPADTGKVMPLAMKEMAGKADGKMISTVLRNLLS